MTEPVPPTDVRLEYRDGTVIPADCVWEGRGRDGVDRWRVVNGRRGEIPRAVMVRTLPPHASIIVDIGPRHG